MSAHDRRLVGIGLYTPAEASRLLHLPVTRLGRWLRGHTINGKHYDPLWSPQIDLGDGRLYLGFSDLMEARVADAFIERGVSARRVRAAIEEASKILGTERPLSHNRFRTDGRDIFLHTSVDGEEPTLLNVLSKQYVFERLLDPILQTVEFGRDGEPMAWWPSGKAANIVLDPERSFGQPVDARSGVPTAILAAAEQSFGVRRAARLYDVSESAVKQSAKFEARLAE